MANIGKGSVLAYTDISPGAYTTVTGMINSNFPTLTISKHDVTTSADTSRQRIQGWKDADDPSFTLLYDKTNYNTIQGLLGTSKTWRITLPDSSTAVFTGFISSIGMPVIHDDALVYTISISLLAAAVTFTAG
jgi:hypothetical protein